jgi:hypothetical protein
VHAKDFRHQPETAALAKEATVVITEAQLSRALAGLNIHLEPRFRADLLGRVQHESNQPGAKPVSANERLRCHRLRKAVLEVLARYGMEE